MFLFFLVSFQKQSMYTHTSSYLTDGGHLSRPSMPLPPSLLLDTSVTLGREVALCPPGSPIASLEDPFPVLFFSLTLSISDDPRAMTSDPFLPISSPLSGPFSSPGFAYQMTCAEPVHSLLSAWGLTCMSQWVTPLPFGSLWV